MSEKHSVHREPEHKEIKDKIKKLKNKLSACQLRLKDANIPVIVLVEGWAAAGKGSLINDLISELDPRFCSFFSLDSVTEDTASHYPFLYPFFHAIPENGKLLFMDSGWMELAVREAAEGNLDEDGMNRRILSVNRFERTLRDNGYLVVKLFVDIDAGTQNERISELRSDEDTAWRVSDADLRQNHRYKEYKKLYHSFMNETGEIFPWNVLSGDNKTQLKHDAFEVICNTLSKALESGKYTGVPYNEEFPMSKPVRLSDADLSLALSEEEYKKRLKKLQKRVRKLHDRLFKARIPVVACFEGWDAAGKGSSIRRLAYPLDPRGFEVCPIASPESHEKNRHFLWRFWTRLPKFGHVTIFDRTWYGRVMVERIEGFCSTEDWQRAYNEINEFEEELHNSGAIVLKFWLQIDSDTQLQRFTARQNTPEKQWKITDEDWRNREKWDIYEQAVSEMLEKTSTEFAPWHVVESVDKKYARIRVLELFAEAAEKALEERK